MSAGMTGTVGSGALLAILRDGRARTKTELVQATGVARSTVSARLDALLEQGWAVPVEDPISSGGRPAIAFAFNTRARVVLAADLGATHARLAVTDLAATVIGERTAEVLITDGPEKVLSWLVTALDELLTETGHDLSRVCGLGVGLPGPVEHDTGRPVSPPIMPGWDGFDVAGWLSERLGFPVMVDNDVNIMALGEHWATESSVDQLIFVKIGTGIGGGIITDGRVHRGAQGAAGDIGHIRTREAGENLVCRCGNTGCLEAVASGSALAARLSAAGIPAATSRDVVRLVRGGNGEAIRLIRQTGREIGDVLASIVSFFNPNVIVVGGDIGEAGEQLLAGIREVVYSRSLPLATQHLLIRTSRLGDRAGAIGAAVMVIESVLAPDAMDLALQASTQAVKTS
ncbi:ROK family transcriptional regulator [Actinocorallia longicatena]|uniref:ROK family protein n=1 Tax=Actinocorallia longicatena TaxID=111803 RepID=A0ABP6QRM4_9ACTN